MITPSTLPWRDRAARIIALGLLAGLLAGCGGGGGGGSLRGRASVTIKWPQPTRLIPVSARSIKIDLELLDGTNVTERVVTAPAPDAPDRITTVNFDNLPVGDLYVRAAAYPNADGSGVAEAREQARVKFTVVADHPELSTFSLTMGTTIQRIAVTGLADLATGATTNITATAYDAGGNVVLIAPTNLLWVTDVTAMTVNGGATATGLTVAAKGVGLGSVPLRATDTESGVSGTLQVSVRAPSYAAVKSISFPGGDTNVVTGGVDTDGAYLYAAYTNNNTNSRYLRRIGLSGAADATVSFDDLAHGVRREVLNVGLDAAQNLYLVVRDRDLTNTVTGASLRKGTLVDLGGGALQFAPDGAWAPPSRAWFGPLAVDKVNGYVYAMYQSGGVYRVSRMNTSGGAELAIDMPTGFTPKIDPTDNATQFAGLAVDSGGALYAAGSDGTQGRIWKWTGAWSLVPLKDATGSTLTPQESKDVAVDGDGYLYMADYRVFRQFGTNGRQIQASPVPNPFALALDGSANLALFTRGSQSNEAAVLTFYQRH